MTLPLEQQRAVAEAACPPPKRQRISDWIISDRFSKPKVLYWLDQSAPGWHVEWNPKYIIDQKWALVRFIAGRLKEKLQESDFSLLPTIGWFVSAIAEDNIDALQEIAWELINE